MNNAAKRIYETLMGRLLPNAQVPGIENMFEPGKECDLLYEQVYDAGVRLAERLGVDGEDRDVELIINNLLRICEAVGHEMYRCGAMLGSGQKE